MADIENMKSVRDALSKLEAQFEFLCNSNSSVSIWFARIPKERYLDDDLQAKLNSIRRNSVYSTDCYYKLHKFLLPIESFSMAAWFGESTSFNRSKAICIDAARLICRNSFLPRISLNNVPELLDEKELFCGEDEELLICWAELLAALVYENQTLPRVNCEMVLEGDGMRAAPELFDQYYQFGERIDWLAFEYYCFATISSQFVHVLAKSVSDSIAQGVDKAIPGLADIPELFKPAESHWVKASDLASLRNPENYEAAIKTLSDYRTTKSKYKLNCDTYGIDSYGRKWRKDKSNWVWYLIDSLPNKDKQLIENSQKK